MQHNDNSIQNCESEKSRRRYHRPQVSCYGNVIALTRGDDCGTIDFPIGDTGFGCELGS